MPFVREYQSQSEVAGPTQSRIERLPEDGGLGGSLQRFGTELSRLDSSLTEAITASEKGDVNQSLAQGHANQSKKLDDLLKNADPSDKNIAEDFMKSYDEDMAKAGADLSTPGARAYFARENAQMRAMFEVKATEKQAQLAGLDAEQTFRGALDSRTAAVYSTPTSLAFALHQNEVALQEQVKSGALSQSAADQLQTESENKITVAAIRGNIRLDPAGTKELLLKGEWDDSLAGEQKATLVEHADMGMRAKAVEENRLEALRRQTRQDAVDALKVQFLRKMYGPQGLSTDEVLNPKNGFDFQDTKLMLGMIEANAKEKVTTNPEVYKDLLGRVISEVTDPRHISDEKEIFQAAARGEITLPVADQLVAHLNGGKTEEGKLNHKLYSNFINNVAKNEITKSTMFGKDPEGDAQYGRFLNLVGPMYLSGLRDGKTAHQMLDPDSPDYLGKYIPQFKRSPDDVAKSLFPINSPSPIPSPSVSPVSAGSKEAPASSTATKPARHFNAADVSAYATRFKISEEKARETLKGYGSVD
jgi:hypothetical protein